MYHTRQAKVGHYTLPILRYYCMFENCPGGGIGRRASLRCWWEETPVEVRVLFWAFLVLGKGFRSQESGVREEGESEPPDGIELHEPGLAQTIKQS